MGICFVLIYAIQTKASRKKLTWKKSIYTRVFEENRALIIHCTESKMLLLTALLHLTTSCNMNCNSFLGGYYIILLSFTFVFNLKLRKDEWQYRSLSLHRHLINRKNSEKKANPNQMEDPKNYHSELYEIILALLYRSKKLHG